MPLTKLFQKRNSLKELSLIKSANEEIEKLNAGAERLFNVDEGIRSHGTSLPDGINYSSISTENEDKYEYIEQGVVDCTVLQNSRLAEIRRRSAPAGKLKLDINKEKPISGWNKCLTESNECDSDIKHDDAETLSLKERQLEDLVGRYVNQWIKESIITAVKNVKVDYLYEKTFENASRERDSSSSADCQPKIESDISDNSAEYTQVEGGSEHQKSEDLEVTRTFENEVIQKEVTPDHTKICETISLDGYLADSEESISLNATEIKVEKTNTSIIESITELDRSKSSTPCENETSDSLCMDKIPIENKNSNRTTTAEVLETDTIRKTPKAIVDQRNISENTTPNEELSPPISDTFCETPENHDQSNGDEKSGKDNCVVIYENLNTELDEKAILNVSVETNLKTSPNEISETKNGNQDNIKGNSPLHCSISDINQSNPSKELNQKRQDSNLMSSNIDASLLPSHLVTQTESDDTHHCTTAQTIPKLQIHKEEEKKMNWKVGFLHVKLPHKTRSKGHLKAWKKRCVSIQPDEFVNDPKYSSVMISVYSGESGSARKHGASFWKSISCQKSVLYRSSSRTHKYAFTISEDNNVVIHLAADSEALSQEWMAAIRCILWPPSPVIQLEKMLHGKEFEISIIDNDFSFRAGLLGMYGYLTITPKKLILVHPHLGYVIQEWYLNTVDKFELMQHSRIEDVHKVLSMTTCSDSSTGKGEILMFCTEAVALLQAVASTIHQILTEHIQQKGGKYEKELAEMADWFMPSPATDIKVFQEEHYKVPPRQVKSLLDIPNFIFDKPLSLISSASSSKNQNIDTPKSLTTTKISPTRASQDSGISAENPSEDILNCSTASFIVGGGTMLGKSSDSELSDSYTPPRSPITKIKENNSVEQKSYDTSL